jgi:hypothetical protein
LAWSSALRDRRKRVAPATTTPDRRKSCSAAKLAEIAIDPALFQTGATHRLFIGIPISNTAAGPIGVALGKSFDVI